VSGGGCVECDRARALEWRAANTEKARKRSQEGARKYRAGNPEKYRERKREWRAANPEKVREHQRRWLAANKDKIGKPAAWPAHDEGIATDKAAIRDRLGRPRSWAADMWAGKWLECRVWEEAPSVAAPHRPFGVGVAPQSRA
jgi:hypothetical protein